MRPNSLPQENCVRNNWLNVDMDGLRQILDRRGKQFLLYELVQNAWDERVTSVQVSLARPVHGYSEIVVTDDSPDGFRDLSDVYTLFASSYKKADPSKRGAFNCGEKFCLAYCEEATITSTTGRVAFDAKGRRRSGSVKRERGSEFRAKLRLTLAEWNQICAAAALLIPPVSTTFNGKPIPERAPLRTWTAKLPTVKADSEGSLRPTIRQTSISIYPILDGEESTLYEMGIPVVGIDTRFHVSIGQKVPLNIDRDNVTMSYLKTVRVEVLNHTHDLIEEPHANDSWVREAAGDARCTNEAIKSVLDLRFGANRVSFDPTDKGSNREAASQNWTVITGGSMSAGEWTNARRAGAIAPAGKLFPTQHSTKEPERHYSRTEWTPEMLAYAQFVERVSPALIGRKITVDFIRDPQMVCGQFFNTHFMVNLAHHDVENWEENILLMTHELTHDVVKSNDHLCHEFYETQGRLGARLALLIAKDPTALSATR
jgi:hypothetical protein